MLKGVGEYLLFTDMDQATPIEEVERLLPHLEKGFDIVIGSRKTVRKGSPLSRKIMSRAWIMIRDIVVGLNGISDTQCGFKIFKYPVAQDIFARMNKIHKGFKEVSGSSVTAGFDVELLYIAQKIGYKVKEVPVEWKYVETRRVSPIKDSLDVLKDLLRIRKNQVKNVY
jgi:hypothetical protein